MVRRTTRAETNPLRDRVAAAIREAHGRVSRETLRAVARGAGVSQSTLLRFLIYRLSRAERRPGRRFRTERLQERTVLALSRTLGKSANWLRTGVGSEQADLGPLLTVESIQAARDAPVEVLRGVIQLLADVDDPALQGRASRAAIDAILRELGGVGRALPLQGYVALATLDAAHAPAGAWKLGEKRRA